MARRKVKYDAIIRDKKVVVKVVYGSYFLKFLKTLRIIKKSISGMTIGRAVLISKNYGEMSKELISHELIHVKQVLDCWFPKKIIFYTKYFYELFKKGYVDNKFEVEAYRTSHLISNNKHPSISFTFTTYPEII